jgi:hypothetical protein
VRRPVVIQTGVKSFLTSRFETCWGERE